MSCTTSPKESTLTSSHPFRNRWYEVRLVVPVSSPTVWHKKTKRLHSGEQPERKLVSANCLLDISLCSWLRTNSYCWNIFGRPARHPLSWWIRSVLLRSDNRSNSFLEKTDSSWLSHVSRYFPMRKHTAVSVPVSGCWTFHHWSLRSSLGWSRPRPSSLPNYTTGLTISA